MKEPGGNSRAERHNNWNEKMYQMGSRENVKWQKNESVNVKLSKGHRCTGAPENDWEKGAKNIKK